MSITGGSSGQGNGVVSISVAANAAPEARTGTLTIAGQAVAVAEEGLPLPSCTVELVPSTATLSADGGAGGFDVRTAAHCAWTAASTAPWLVVTSPRDGTGPGNVVYTVERLSGQSSRHGTITVGDQTFTLVQNGESVVCEYRVAPVELSPCMSVPYDLTTEVTAEAGCSWTAVPDVSWIRIVSGASGWGSGKVTFRVTDNWDDPRLGIVMVRWPTVTAGQNVRVAQAGCRYATSATDITIAGAGAASSFDVYQQSDPTNCGGPLQDRCLWTAQADVPWITITTSMPQSGDNRLSFTVAPNDAAVSRAGTITVRNRVVRVTQQPR
jgi:hypothetical protein